MLVLAPVVFVAALFTVLSPLFNEDAVFSAADSPVQVQLPAGEERGLFADAFAEVSCAVTDGSGAEVRLRPVSGDFTINEWTAAARFDTSDGDLTFDCGGPSPDAEIRIGELPSTGGFVAGIAIGLIVPMLLGVVAILMLIILTILYATGAPRDEATA